ncbi:MAG: Flp pilus assembly complex ATPase component TadA [Fimbriimonadaceae bacterium]|nr:MAG: Flp pilus assembly complex ATPase component TadA [Fimbriimonadaceae bacterium]
MGEKFSWDRLLKRGKDSASEDNTIEIVQEAPAGLGPVAPLGASKPAPKPQLAPPQMTAPPVADKDRAPLVIDWSEYQQLEANAPADAPEATLPPIEVPNMETPVAPPTPAEVAPVAEINDPAKEGFWEKLNSETTEAFGNPTVAMRRAEALTPKPQIAGWDDVDLTPSEKSVADPVTNSISVPEYTPRDPKEIEQAIQSISQSSAWEDADAEATAPTQPPASLEVPPTVSEAPAPPAEFPTVFQAPPVEEAPVVSPPEQPAADAFHPYVDPNAPTWGESTDSTPPVEAVSTELVAPEIPVAFHQAAPIAEEQEAYVEDPIVSQPPIEEPPVAESAPIVEEPVQEVQNSFAPVAEVFEWPVITEDPTLTSSQDATTWNEIGQPINENFEPTEEHPTELVSEFVCPPLVPEENGFQIQNPWESADEADPVAGFVPSPVTDEPEDTEPEAIIAPQPIIEEPIAESDPVTVEPELVEEQLTETDATVVEETEAAPLAETESSEEYEQYLAVPPSLEPTASAGPVTSTEGNFWDAILGSAPATEEVPESEPEDQPVQNSTPVRSDLPDEYTHISEDKKQEEVAKDSRIGELLVNHKLVSQGQIERAIKRQQETNEKLGQILISMGIMTERRLLQVLAAQKGVSPWHLEEDRPSQDAIRLLPQEMCRVFQMLPVAVRGDLLLLAMRDTSDAEAIEAVRLHTKKRVEPVLADEARLAFHIDRAFGVAAQRNAIAVDEIVQNALETIAQKSEDEIDLEPNFNGPNTVPVNALVDQIVLDAIHAGASDVHLEPSHNKVEVRYRISGRLRTVRELPLELSELVVARLKFIGHLDVNQTLVPQSGRVSADFANHAVDFKISVLPNPHGSRIVLRLLDRSLGLKTLDELGFESENLKMFRDLINRPYGLFVIAGPTGNGKTTTLYSALGELQDSGLNIMTCEDPIEFDLVGINQTEVDRSQGLTYATQLKAILEQDPDVILVGEIRDRETAEVAVRAAISGKKVFATLDTNDAAGAVPRLIELGVEPAILATALNGIMSQRLLRTLDSETKAQSPATSEEKELLRVAFGVSNIEELWRATASEDSDGYIGRCAAHEILPITPEVARLIAEQATCEEIKELAGYYGYLPIQFDALSRIVAGQISLEEAQRNIAFDTFEKRELARKLDQAS